MLKVRKWCTIVTESVPSRMIPSGWYYKGRCVGEGEEITARHRLGLVGALPAIRFRGIYDALQGATVPQGCSGG